MTTAGSELLNALQQTVRADPEAYGLYDAACAAGGRLAHTMTTLMAPEQPQQKSPPEDFLTQLTDEVGGRGGTATDAALRRAAASAGQRVLDERERTAPDGPFSGDLLCFLYQWFFADVVAEFLSSVLAEQIKLAVPLLPAVDPEDTITEWIADQIYEMVPNPCMEAEKQAEAAESAIALAGDPSTALPGIARELVPGTVGKILGLIAESDEANDGGEETSA